MLTAKIASRSPTSAISADRKGWGKAAGWQGQCRTSVLCSAAARLVKHAGMRLQNSPASERTRHQSQPIEIDIRATGHSHHGLTLESIVLWGRAEGWGAGEQ